MLSFLLMLKTIDYILVVSNLVCKCLLPVGPFNYKLKLGVQKVLCYEIKSISCLVASYSILLVYVCLHLLLSFVG